MPPDETNQAPTNTLRDRQRDLTRETILNALAAIVSDGDVHDFTVQQVAERAGVSHRTVYRHFPTREALLEALAEWLDQELGRRGTPMVPQHLDDFVDSAPLVFSLFDEYAPLVRALVITYTATGVRPAPREERTRALERVVAEAAPHVSETERRDFFAVTRALLNSQAYQFFRDHLGLTGTDAGRAVAWAVRTLVDDLRAREERARARQDGSRAPDEEAEASG